jgi:hypothetical protein
MGCKLWRSSLVEKPIVANKSEFGFAQIRARNHSQLLNEICDEINSDWTWNIRCLDEPWY